jgi:hypothetical protein
LAFWPVPLHSLYPIVWIGAPKHGVTADAMPEAPSATQMLRDKAERCRRFAGATIDSDSSPQTAGSGAEFEEQAAVDSWLRIIPPPRVFIGSFARE